MVKNGVTYKDLYIVIGEFRKENNERFDHIESIFQRHCDDQNKFAEKYIGLYQSDIREIDKRIKPLEKIADRILVVIAFLSGAVTIFWQVLTAWVKKELKI